MDMYFSIGSLILNDLLVWYVVGFLIYFGNELWICLNYKILTFSLTLNERLVEVFGSNVTCHLSKSIVVQTLGPT